MSSLPHRKILTFLEIFFASPDSDSRVGIAGIAHPTILTKNAAKKLYSFLQGSDEPVNFFPGVVEIQTRPGS